MRELSVEIVRSKKRKKTAQAYIVEGRLRVLIPAGMEPDAEAGLVADLVRKTSRRVSSEGVDLHARAAKLAKRYGLPPPATIGWSNRQLRRWGSCTVSEGRIRISDRLASMPDWVLDWVILHELAHLAVPDHGPRFQEIIAQYQLGERAEGYLIARSEIGP
ncbi:MAG: M48 family metallopeptidase [Acidimicrobiia bacterium]